MRVSFLPIIKRTIVSASKKVPTIAPKPVPKSIIHSKPLFRDGNEISKMQLEAINGKKDPVSEIISFFSKLNIGTEGINKVK